MIEAKREAVKKMLTRIKENKATRIQLYDMGIDLSEFANPLVDCMEETAALFVSENDQQFEAALDIIQWWLYESVDKYIYTTTEPYQIIHDLTDIEAFVDYLFAAKN